MAVMRLREGDKREVMGRKKGLKEGSVWIEDGLTWKERRSRWLFKEAVMAQERRGAKVWVRNGRVAIERE